MSDDEVDFEEQIRQEAEERKRAAATKTRVEEDGTVMEWDPAKNAWFPKIDDDFIAKYQMQYGSGVSSEGTTSSGPAPPGGSTAAPDVNDPAYHYWYYHHYQQSQGEGGKADATDSKSYQEWYKQYYDYYYSQGHFKDGADADKTGNEDSASGDTSKTDTETDADKKDGDSEKTDAEKQKEYSDYWSYYYSYYGYGQQGEDAGDGKEVEGKDSAKDNDGDKKDGAKLPAKRKDPVWFEADEKQHTNVYVSGLPTDITDQEYEELMKKCGLIMLDPKTRKLKLKLYTNEDGSNKGDARCCYIRSESVDLALQMLDGYDVRGHKIKVERAKFTLKGEFDAAKAKRRKLTNKEKKRLREKQEKLFDWRPDRPANERGRNERVVIIKNVFNPTEFDKDPKLINEIRNDMRDECGKYGDVRKVVVYDRHPEGVVGVTMREPEEADVCLEAVNGRWFGGKQLSAAAWDGKTKYDVAETEEERNARLKQWENFLEEKEGSNSGSQPPPAASTSQ